MRKRIGEILKIVAVFALCAIGMTACDDGVLFQDVKMVSEGGWSKDEAIDFVYEMQDTAGIYEIVVDIRNTGDYKYQNLWLFVEATNPNGLVYADTLECALADNMGRWVGDGAASYYSNVYHLPVSFMPMVKFPVKGEYKFKIWQGMREDVLTGISDVGIRIRKPLE